MPIRSLNFSEALKTASFTLFWLLPFWLLPKVSGFSLIQLHSCIGLHRGASVLTTSLFPSGEKLHTLFAVLPCLAGLACRISVGHSPIKDYMGMKVRFPCLAVLVSLVFMYVDLYCLYPKSFLCLSGELLELLHGCAFWITTTPSRMGVAFCCIF